MSNLDRVTVRLDKLNNTDLFLQIQEVHLGHSLKVHKRFTFDNWSTYNHLIQVHFSLHLNKSLQEVVSSSSYLTTFTLTIKLWSQFKKWFRARQPTFKPPFIS